MGKIDHSLFDADKHALEKKSESCPKCHANLVIKHGKTGPFLGCSNYPTCNYIRSFASHDTHDIKILDDSPCPECGKDLVIRNGRYGMFIGCTGYPQCHFIVHDTEQASEQLPRCPKCNSGQLVKRSNKYGKQFYSCDAYPKCKYSLNHLPVDETCPQCGWGVMLEKSRGGKLMLQCPQKSCQFKVEKTL